MIEAPDSRFDIRAVVPAAGEDHDFSGGREKPHVALEEHLRFFAVRRSGQGYHSKGSWRHPLGDRFDRTPLAGGVAPLKQDNRSKVFGLDPLLEMTELDLELAQFLFVQLSFHPW